MSVINSIKFILNHPLNKNNKIDAILKVIKWQLSCTINPYPVIYPFVENSKLIIWKGLDGATCNLYCGLFEFEDMAFLLHYLRKEDQFLDVGANIGSFTILSSAVVGASTICFEPINSTFKNLVDNIRINKIEDNVTALNIGIGSKSELLKFTNSFDALNRVAFAGELDTTDIVVEKLDNIKQINSENLTLIKIDVEGFESEVIAGAAETLSNNSLNAIIIELNGSGQRYGKSDNDIHLNLLKLGFHSYRYEPFGRDLIEIKGYNKHNTIYIRDLQLAIKRVKSAPFVNVLNTKI